MANTPQLKKFIKRMKQDTEIKYSRNSKPLEFDGFRIQISLNNINKEIIIIFNK